METTDEESTSTRLTSTGHTETTVDSRKVSPSVRVTLQTPAQVGFAFVDVGFRKNYNSALTVNDS